MNCQFCNRLAKGFGWKDPESPRAKRYIACSWDCMVAIQEKKGILMTLDHFEQDAVEHASTRAGAYLEGLGKFDLVSLTSEEWLGMIRLVYVEATGKVGELHKAFEADVPF